MTPAPTPARTISGWLHSLGWAVGSGPVVLAVHAALGLLSPFCSVVLAGFAIARRARGPMVRTGLASAQIIGAGFNGTSFLDFGRNYSSLAMALLSLGALTCYLLARTFSAGDG